MPKNSPSRATRNLKNRAAQETQPQAGSGRWGWGQIGLTNYVFLFVCVVSQLATILITWPAWQVRDDFPNLPWIESTPQFSCGILLIMSLVFVLISPRRFGMVGHLVVLGIAIGMDQFRCQPQILGVTFLMAACVWPWARRLCVWYLVSMWLWAGIHKWVSPDWMGPFSYHLLSRAGVDPRLFHLWFAVGIAVSEVALGVCAILRPKFAAIPCVFLHLGIVIFLLVIRWNFSVLPWNLCTAIVGGWLLWGSPNLETANPRLALPDQVWEKIAVAAILFIPVGIYFGVVRNCFAHVLYSGNLPTGVITYRHGAEPIDSWDELRFPFPSEQNAYRDFFARTGTTGEKLHIRDPRPGIASHFYVLEGTGALSEITADEFFGSQNGAVSGFAQDDPRALLALELGHATMMKRSEKEMIYAVKFEPGEFNPEQLSLLSGLPNIEQMQLADCNVQDEDLKRIPELPKLMGIGLNRTAITDAGLKHLKRLPNLSIIEHNGTAITKKGLETLGISDR